jgi:hypothetical protein
MTYPFVQAANDYGKLPGPVLAFVIHIAEGGGTVGFLSRDNARGVSVHYVIEYTGRVVQMLREDHASGSINPREIRTDNGPSPFGYDAAHAVLGSWMRDPNGAVLSCEIEGFASTGPNAKQQGALRALVADIRTRHPNIGLLGHRDFQNYKACPGPHIPWALLGGHGEATMALKYTPIANEVGGKVEILAATQAIPIEGGSRIAVPAGPIRPAIGTFTLDDLPARGPQYLMVVGDRLAFVDADAVAFTADDGANTATAADCSALEAKIAAAKAALA